MTCPPSEGSWFILGHLNNCPQANFLKITLKIIFDKKISKKNYCSKDIFYVCVFLCVRKGHPLSCWGKGEKPGLKCRLEENLKVFSQRMLSVSFTSCILNIADLSSQSIASLMWLKNSKIKNSYHFKILFLLLEENFRILTWR